MEEQSCFFAICFISLPADVPQIFGFAEYMAALALMVIAWTLADSRYRFRLESAVIPLKLLSFCILIGVGVLALATDVWRHEQYPVPKGNLLTPVLWQAFLASLFMTLFFVWAWFGLIRPSKYGPLNAKRYVKAVAQRTLDSSEHDLAALSEELASSSEKIVELAASSGRGESAIASLTSDLLLIIADPRFCNVVVSQKPLFAILLFRAMNKSQKLGIPIGLFGRNLASAAFSHSNSILRFETEGYDTGYLGYVKPLGREMFSNSELVEEVGTLFDIDYETLNVWTEKNWDLYSRALLVFLEDRLNRSNWTHSYVLHRAMENMIGSGHFQLSKVDGEAATNDPAFQKFNIGCEFVRSSMRKFGETEPHCFLNPIKGGSNDLIHGFGKKAYGLLETASYVSDQGFFCWTVQHNMAFDSIYGRLGGPQNKTTRQIERVINRIAYDKILDLGKYGLPGHDSARMLGLLLNVSGFSEPKKRPKLDDGLRSFYPLRMCVLMWTYRHFTWLAKKFPEVAESALVEKIEYEPAENRLVYLPMWSRGRRVYFDLDPKVIPPPE